MTWMTRESLRMVDTLSATNAKVVNATGVPDVFMLVKQDREHSKYRQAVVAIEGVVGFIPDATVAVSDGLCSQHLAWLRDERERLVRGGVFSWIMRTTNEVREVRYTLFRVALPDDPVDILFYSRGGTLTYRDYANRTWERFN